MFASSIAGSVYAERPGCIAGHTTTATAAEPTATGSHGPEHPAEPTAADSAIATPDAVHLADPAPHSYIRPAAQQ